MTFTKPDQLPMWADQDQVSNVSLQNNVLVPPPALQQYGWTFKQFPPRNFFNWLGRYTYRWLAWLNQQEAQSVVTDGNGIGLFITDGAMIYLYAVDKVTPANFIFAIGFKGSGVVPVLNVIANNVLTLGASTTGGNQIISGGTAANIIANGQSKIISV
jgi:hypothetical protein